MDPDDQVCLCFRVSLRKIRGYLARENPPVASLISECLSAGTGCQWCVPFLRHLHKCHVEGKPVDLSISPQAYAEGRRDYRDTGTRAPLTTDAAGDADADNDQTDTRHEPGVSTQPTATANLDAEPPSHERTPPRGNAKPPGDAPGG